MVEVPKFYEGRRFQQMRDVYHFLYHRLEHTKELIDQCWSGFEPIIKTGDNGLLSDLEWRIIHLGIANDWKTLMDFWAVCNSDLSWQLTEGQTRTHYLPLDGLYPALSQKDTQALHKHRFFLSAQLVRDCFRCFHRGNGRSYTLRKPFRSEMNK